MKLIEVQLLRLRATFHALPPFYLRCKFYACAHVKTTLDYLECMQRTSLFLPPFLNRDKGTVGYIRKATNNREKRAANGPKDLT